VDTTAELKEDAESVRGFFQGWMRYWRAVDEDYLGHREAYALLNCFLRENHPEPFLILDCGCGDSSYMVKGLVGTSIAHYTGVDMSENALELAKQNLEGLGFDVELIPGDYAELMKTLKIEPDVIWIGLSLHHLPAEQKRVFLRECREKLKHKGCHMLIFEPMSWKEETREHYLNRWWATCWNDWSAISADDKRSFRDHVFTSDFPESHDAYQRLAEEAGFHGADLLMTDQKELYGMLALHPIA
jgi:SAM-dependent methyltransferase